MRKKLIIKELLLISTITVFWILLIGHFKNIYKSFNERSVLNNIDEEKALIVKDLLTNSFNNTSVRNSLYKYFMFFYTKEYTERAVYLSSDKDFPGVDKQIIEDDPFYVNLLNYHKNDSCFAIRTADINKESVVYSSLLKTIEIGEHTFYISCPIYVNNILIGYIGALYNGESSLVSISINIIRNTASNIENVLEGR